MPIKRGSNLIEDGKATRFQKGMEKHPNAGAPFKPEFHGGKFSKEFVKDMAWAYKKIGGKRWILAHIRRDPKLSEKFLDKLIKISTAQIARESELKISGHMEHDHRYGFNPEGLMDILNQFKIAGDININLLMQAPIPKLPEAEKHILADVVDITPQKLPDKVKIEEVNVPHETLSFEEEERLALEGAI